MRFRLLFFALIPAVIASSSPDEDNREVHVSSNVEPITTTVLVYPATDEFNRDRHDDTTDGNLEAVYGDRVEKTHDSDGKQCWKLSLIEGEPVSQLQNWRDLDIPGVGYEERKQKFTRRRAAPGPVTYWAVARDADDTEETATTFAYLKTKIEPGAQIHQLNSFGRLRWGPLHLSPETLQEIAQYPGIRAELIEDRPLIKC
jgi:hypothetical protein